MITAMIVGIEANYNVLHQCLFIISCHMSITSHQSYTIKVISLLYVKWRMKYDMLYSFILLHIAAVNINFKSIATYI